MLFSAVNNQLTAGWTNRQAVVISIMRTMPVDRREYNICVLAVFVYNIRIVIVLEPPSDSRTRHIRYKHITYI